MQYFDRRTRLSHRVQKNQPKTRELEHKKIKLITIQLLRIVCACFSLLDRSINIVSNSMSQKEIINILLLLVITTVLYILLVHVFTLLYINNNIISIL